MKKYAKIIENIIAGYMEVMPKDLFMEMSSIADIIFVYDIETGELIKDRGDEMHKNLMMKHGWLKEKEQYGQLKEMETYKDVVNRVVRGFYVNKGKILVVYPMYQNGRQIEPLSRYVEAVIASLNVEPNKVYISR